MKLVCVLELDGRWFILLFDKENMYKDRNVLHNDLHVFVELCLFIVTCSLLLFIHNCGNVFRKCSLINFKKLSNFTFLIIYHFFNFDLFCIISLVASLSAHLMAPLSCLWTTWIFMYLYIYIFISCWQKPQLHHVFGLTHLFHVQHLNQTQKKNSKPQTDLKSAKWRFIVTVLTGRLN